MHQTRPAPGLTRYSDPDLRDYTPEFITGPNDHSPTFIMYRPDRSGAGFDDRCDCCYLGFSHSVDYHRAAIAAAEEER